MQPLANGLFIVIRALNQFSACSCHGVDFFLRAIHPMVIAAAIDRYPIGDAGPDVVLAHVAQGHAFAAGALHLGHRLFAGVVSAAHREDLVDALASQPHADAEGAPIREAQLLALLGRIAWIVELVVEVLQLHRAVVRLDRKHLVQQRLQPEAGDACVVCLVELEDLIRPGFSVLDVGAGTAILSIGAALRQAAPVLAVEIDDVAVRVTPIIGLRRTQGRFVYDLRYRPRFETYMDGTLDDDFSRSANQSKISSPRPLPIEFEHRWSSPSMTR